MEEGSRSRPATTAVAVFARLPVPGRVKTRLAATLASGHEGACDFYRSCASHVISRVASFEGASVTVFHSSGDDTQAFKEWLHSFVPETVGVLPQTSSPDLGAKMHTALQSLLEQPGMQKAIVIGTDIPDLDADVIASAIEALDQYKLVVGPAVDGGYYLLGCRVSIPLGIFEGIEWSTPTVLSKTLERAAALGLEVAPTETLPKLQDIDNAEDLKRWLQTSKTSSSKLYQVSESLLG